MVQQLVGSSSLGLGKLIDGKNQFIHIRYSANANGLNMTTEIQADTKYIGIATNSSETAPTSPSDYSWGRFVGTPGASSYTWIRYSSNADGSNMTAIPNEETKYIGVAITSEDSAPTDYTKYSWALFRGSDGRGVKKTEVSYQKSASGTVIPTGAWLASIPSLNEGEYLWTRTLFTYTDGTTTSTYNVSRNGMSGLGIARTDVHYQKSTSGTTAPTGTWTVTIPTVRANEYLWTRTTITYTDDSTSVSYSVGKMGADGKDAQLLYLTASSQIQAFDKDNQPKTTQPITISAKLQNASGTATFVAIPYIGNTAQTPITLGGTGNDRTLLPSQWTDPKWTIIAITATLGSLTDTISVNKVKDGESGETPVVHIAWADSSDGSEGFTLELPEGKIPKYRGYYVDYSTVASTDPKKYKWERNPDDTGAEVDKAMTAVESAVANAEEAERLAATASQTATIAKQEASAAQNAASMAQGEVSRIEGVIVDVQGDIDTALQEVADQAADLQATKETLELNYAKKTEVSDVQAALTTEISKKVGELQTTVSQTYAAKNEVVAMEGRLQSQITQTAGEVSSVVGKVEKLESDTTEAQKKVDEALEKSAAAQATADKAQAYADAADKKVAAAQTDLNEAKQNLTATINRVDATEADIAEAQLKVESAQAAVAQAQKDAAEAALAASNAQAAADKAQQDVAALTKRVVSAETAITQNSEQIQLTATKTEEIGDELKNNYYTKEQADAAITVKADSITQTVSSTYATKGNAIKSSIEEFYQSTSPTSLSGGSWSTTQPTWAQGKYIWRRTKNTYGNDTVVYTPSVNGVCITGNTGATGATGQKGNGVSSTIVSYGVSSSGIIAPVAWQTTIPTVSPSNYLWTRTVLNFTDGTSSTSYSVGKIGEQGPAGAKGDKGDTGATGATLYTWVKYANDSSGNGMSDSPSGKKYIGLAYNKTTTIESTNANDYQWALIQGEQGIPGQKGDNGATLYTWMKYADTDAGSGMSDNPTGKRYIGLAYNKTTSTESTNPADYTWSLIKGDKGDPGQDGLPGKDGVGLKSTVITYGLSSSDTTQPTSWSAQVPTLTKGKFLWTKTVWTYTDNTSETSYQKTYIARDGNNGTDGLPGKDGVGIKSTTITYAASTSGTTKPTSGWSATIPSVSSGQYLWTRTVWTYTDETTETSYSVSMMGERGPQGLEGAQGPKGDQGIQGRPGTDGRTSYAHIAYADSADGTKNFSTSDSNRLYIGFYTDFNATDSSTPSSYRWSLIKGADGRDGADGVPGRPGADGRTPYFHTAYANSADGSSGFSTTDSNGKLYLGTCTDYNQNDPTDYRSYTWVKIKGDKGDQGVQGPKGENGQSLYTWLKYADDVNGNGMSEIPDGKKYIGLAYNKTTPTESSNPRDYTWSLIQGANGVNGADGKTYYTWVKYADSATGSGLSDNPAGKSYIGLAYNKTTSTESTNPGDYSWSLIKGDKGDTGNGIAKTTISYGVSSSGTTAPTSWSSTIPTVSPSNYLWTKTVITYTDNTTSTSYSVGKMGEQGAKGDKGDTGATLYTWVKYANDANGSGMSDYPSGKKYIGLAYNKTTATESSIASDYQWALIQGEQGIPGQKGEDGATLYTWIKYADNASGGGLSDSANGKKYVGIAYNKTTSTESTNPADYTWSLIQGPQGPAGQNGKGVSSYSITYQAGTSGTTAPTGTWTTTIPTVPQGQYLWTKMVITYTDNTSSTSYSVSYIPVNGQAGATGNGVKSITTEFYLSTSKTTQTGGEWSTTQPTWSPGKYVWTRNKITYTNGSTAYTSPQCSSEWEAVNNIQVGGRNLLPKRTIGLYVGGTTQTGQLTNLLVDGYKITTTARPVDLIGFVSSIITGSEIIVSGLTNLASINCYYRFRKKDGSTAGDQKNLTASVVGGRFEFSITVPTSAAYIHIGLGQYPYVENYYIENVKLEIGNQATDWSPAPEDMATTEDMDNLTQTVNTKIEQTSGRIDLVASSVTEVGNKLDNLQVGGENLFIDAAFRNKTLKTDNDSNKVPGSWVAYNNGGNYKFAEYNNQINYLQLTGKASGNLGMAQFYNTDTLQKGKEYCIRVFTMCEDADYKIGINLIKKNSSGSFSWYYKRLLDTDVKASADFTERKVNFTIPLDDDVAMYGISIINYGAASSDGHVIKFVKPKLEEGNTYTDFSISSKDMATKDELTNNYYSKTQTDAAIKVATDSITSTVRTEITTVNNKVDNLQVGGRNLLRHSEIDTISDNENSKWWNFSTDNAQAYKEEFNSDEKYLSIKHTSGNLWGQWQQELPITHNLMKLVVGDNLIIGADVWINDNTSGGNIGIEFRVNSKTNYNDYFSIKKEFPPSELSANTWQRVYAVGKITQKYIDNKNDLQLSRVILFRNSCSKPNEIRFRKVKPELGNIPTDWTPAPEDQQAQIDNIQVGGRNLLRDTKNEHTVSLTNLSSWAEGRMFDIDTPTKNGEQYVLSFEAKASENGYIMQNHWYHGSYSGSKHPVIKAVDQDGNVQISVPDTDGATFITLTTEYKRYYIIFDVRDSVGKTKIIVGRLNDREKLSNTGWVKIKEFKLEKGNKPTAWSPAPEDMATAEQAQQAQDDANDANSKADATEHRVSVAESTIKQLSDSISTLVTDSNGSSMMTQTSDGWTFNIGAITDAVNSATNSIDDLSGSLSQTNNVVNNLNNLANDLSKKTAYINMTTDETGAPCIELGKTGNAFKVRITNTSVDFIQGSSKIAYVSNQALFIEKAIIKSELQIGERQGFIWKTRSNGNMGLRWFG